MKTVSIGRDTKNNIVLKDKTVSRMHAQLIISGDNKVLIKDIGSSNGTFINGHKISEQYLHDGDIVKCGSAFLNWAHVLQENQSENPIPKPTPVVTFKKEKFRFSLGLIDVSEIRHEKEKTYFIISAIFSSIFWFAGLSVILFTGFIGYKMGGGWIILLGFMFLVLFMVIVLWIASLFFKASLYGRSVLVNSNQYPEIYKISMEASQRLGLKNMPDIFICNHNGMVNAHAIKMFSDKYVLLSAGIVDLMLSSKNIDALSMIIGHEIGHHSTGHTSSLKNVFLMPAFIVPFLGAAYHRACELTADRIGFILSDSLSESQYALFAIALGSEHLLQTGNINEFSNQETEIPEFIGFLQKIFSLYPRTTKRVLEITSYGNKNRIL